MGCVARETADAFVERERGSLLVSFMCRLQEPCVMSNSKRMYEKLSRRYSGGHCDGRREELCRFNWWVYDIHEGVRADELREFVRGWMSRSKGLDGAIRRLYPAGRAVFHDGGVPFTRSSF